MTRLVFAGWISFAVFIFGDSKDVFAQIYSTDIGVPEPKTFDTSAPASALVDLCGEVEPPVEPISIALKKIGMPGNNPNHVGEGSVPYPYWISKYEVTNGQYAIFLNAIARQEDTHVLYSTAMASQRDGGILRISCEYGFLYLTKPHFQNKPVNYVSWSNAARFVNWLHHFEPIGVQDHTTTETGVYDLQYGDQLAYLFGLRMPGARWAIPSGDEWTKAAKFCGSCIPEYWTFSVQSHSNPIAGVSGQSSATETGDFRFPSLQSVNYGELSNWNGTSNGNVTTVGSAGAPSPWGTFDQDGNVREWTEKTSCWYTDTCGRAIVGGSYSANVGRQLGPNSYLESGLTGEISPMSSTNPLWTFGAGERYRDGLTGFRVVRLN